MLFTLRTPYLFFTCLTYYGNQPVTPHSMGGKQSKTDLYALGLSGSGKSLLFSTMKGAPFEGPYPGVELHAHQHGSVRVGGMGPKKQLPLLWEGMRGTTNVVFVVDSTNAEGMVELSHLIELFFTSTDDRREIDDVSKWTILVYATKQDMESALEPEEVARSIGFDGKRLVPKKLVVQGTSMTMLKENGAKGWKEAFG